MAVTIPAASVRPVSRSSTRPICLHAAPTSMQIGLSSVRVTTAAAWVPSARGFGAEIRSPRLSTAHTKVLSTAGVHAAWQKSSQVKPRVSGIGGESVRSCTSITLATRTGLRGSQSTLPAPIELAPSAGADARLTSTHEKQLVALRDGASLQRAGERERAGCLVGVVDAEACAHDRRARHAAQRRDSLEQSGAAIPRRGQGERRRRMRAHGGGGGGGGGDAGGRQVGAMECRDRDEDGWRRDEARLRCTRERDWRCDARPRGEGLRLDEERTLEHLPRSQRVSEAVASGAN
eukprot:5554138-Pleurochrysis_carterae.AAC.4